MLKTHREANLTPKLQGFVYQVEAFEARRHLDHALQVVARHLGLAVDYHRLGSMRLQVDPVAFSAEGELDAAMDEALEVGARAGTYFIE